MYKRQILKNWASMPLKWCLFLSLTKWAHIVIMTVVSSTITGAITPYVFFLLFVWCTQRAIVWLPDLLCHRHSYCTQISCKNKKADKSGQKAQIHIPQKNAVVTEQESKTNQKNSPDWNPSEYSAQTQKKQQPIKQESLFGLLAGNAVKAYLHPGARDKKRRSRQR